VLQGWSKNSFTQRALGVAFMIALAFAARWGVRLLFGWHIW